VVHVLASSSNPVGSAGRCQCGPAHCRTRARRCCRARAARSSDPAEGDRGSRRAVHRGRDGQELAIELLEIAAEVEHALMVQYLYATTSIPPPTDGVNYREKVLDIAIEGMGHLATVQNLLILLGGRDAIYMQRDLMRVESEKNPIPFVLEPVTRTSLAKYVAGEKPAEVPADIAEEVRLLVELATKDAGGDPNRVGVIYELLHWMFTPADLASASDDIDFASLAPLPAILILATPISSQPMSLRRTRPCPRNGACSSRT
jgi:hypothetical protein